jgi:hypothetical protein
MRFALPLARIFALTALIGFLCLPVGEMSAGLSGVTFTVGPDQKKAQQVVIENLNLIGLGVFARVPVGK